MNKYFSNLIIVLNKAIQIFLRVCWVFFISLEDILLPRRALCVALGDGEVSLIHGYKFLFFRNILGVKRIELQESEITPEVIAGKVETYTEKLKAYRANVTLSIPGDLVLFQTAEFPSVVETNLKDVVSFEFDRLTPFTANQVYYDYEVIESRKQRLQVSLSVALAEPIDGFIHAFSRKNLKIQKVTVNSSGLVNVISRHSKMPDYLFVAPYKNGFEGGLISRGGIVQTFQGNFKGRKKEEAIATEILPIMIALTEEKRSFDILLLHHNDFDLDLGPVLSHPVKNIKPLQNRDVQSFSAYAAAGSMIGSLQGRGSNLLSRGTRPQRSISLALTSCLLLLGMVTAGLYYFIPLDHKTQKVVEIERQIKLRETEVKKVQKLKKEADSLQAEMDAVQGFRNHKPMMINIFKDLTTRVPQTAWLTTVKVTEKDMYIGGYAADAAALLPKMGTIGPFQKAEFASPVTRDSRTNTYNFSIKMESKDGGNAKKNDPKK